MQVKKYPEWAMLPQNLSIEETECPHNVIEELFDYAHLPEVRTLLWEWLKTTVTGDYTNRLDANERASIIYLYEKLSKLVEAAHLLNEQHKKTVAC